jgi:hypothetical protein
VQVVLQLLLLRLWQGCRCFRLGCLLVTSKLELVTGLFFFFVFLSVQWSPTASVHSFFVVDSETQFDRCWSFNCKSSVVRKFSSNSPLESSEVKVHCNEGIVVSGVVAGSIVSPAVFFVKPLGFFDVSFRDVLLPPT